MLNDHWQAVPMAQFFVVSTARATYLMTYARDWDWKWGYARILKELPK